MPIVQATAVPIITASLAATTMLGVGVPKYATGVANGLTLWIPQITVTTVDAGSAGVGVGVIPLIVPPPLLIANITTGMASMGLMGVAAPLFILGLSNGLATTFAQGLVTTQHPGVGTGAGVAKFVATPALPSILAGFAMAGMIGPVAAQKAAALAIGLDMTFASLVLPTPIVGSASPVATAGVGFGKIL